MSNPLVLQYNKIPLAYKKLTEANRPLGTVFRICNKKGKSYIWHSNSVEETIKHYIRQLNNNSFSLVELQHDYNKNKNAFFIEDLAHYYSEQELYHVLSSYVNYYGGKDFDNLYNSAEVKTFLQSIPQVTTDVVDLSNDSAIMQRIVKDPLTMLQVLSSYMTTCATYINTKYSSQQGSNQVDKAKDISPVEDISSVNDIANTIAQAIKSNSEENNKSASITLKNVTQADVISNSRSIVDKPKGNTVFELKTIGDNGFPYYKENESLNDYIMRVTPFLKSSPQFLRELKDEVKRFISIKMQVKDILSLRIKNISMISIAKELNKRPEYRKLTAKNAGASCDALQITYPAIYLIYGFGAYSRTNRKKRVLAELEKRGITDTPML